MPTLPGSAWQAILSVMEVTFNPVIRTVAATLTRLLSTRNVMRGPAGALTTKILPVRQKKYVLVSIYEVSFSTLSVYLLSKAPHFRENPWHQ